MKNLAFYSSNPVSILCFLGLLTGLLFSGCHPQNKPLELQSGLLITRSVSIRPDTFRLDPLPGDSAVITISGDNIVVDFNGAVLRSSLDPQRPDQFQGLGIQILGGHNIQIRNAVIHGFKVGIYAADVDSLQILDGDLSYNFRQQLHSTPAKESENDWLSFHHNEKDEWLRYGAGVYLKNCQKALVKGLKITGGQNGLLLVNCSDGQFYNNSIQYNSGLGIGLYRSSRNWVMHNRLDWNIRGYSHGVYHRGQDSAGLLVYEQSSDNIFAYNSATHSGDGFFLWAGQQTMDTGEGGCNNNLVYGNDFSHASNNGVEITFSSNNIVNNRLEDCDYGIWGGYSYRSILLGNVIKNNRFGIAIEQGQGNLIRFNHFAENDTGIALWERGQQPADWGFAKARNVENKDYEISNNQFESVKIPLKISNSKGIVISENDFSNYTTLLVEEGKNQDLHLTKNTFAGSGNLGAAAAFRSLNHLKKSEELRALPLASLSAEYAPSPLPDGMNTQLPEGTLRGRQYMLIGPWGPYDFRYPAIWLRSVEGDKYTFAIFGPEGNWKLTGGEGFGLVSRKSGAMPATIVAEKESGAEKLSIELSFFGEAAVTVFGEKIKRGKEIPFAWKAE